MKNEPDVLADWDEKMAPHTGTVTAAAIAWTAQNIFSLAMVAYSFRVPGFDAMEYYMKAAVLVPLLIGRVSTGAVGGATYRPILCATSLAEPGY